VTRNVGIGNVLFIAGPGPARSAIRARGGRVARSKNANSPSGWLLHGLLRYILEYISCTLYNFVASVQWNSTRPPKNYRIHNDTAQSQTQSSQGAREQEGDVRCVVYIYGYCGRTSRAGICRRTADRDASLPVRSLVARCWFSNHVVLCIL
jgi:hypothetical protein